MRAARAATGPLTQDITDVLDQSRDMHMITDSAGGIKYVNPAFESATGFCQAGVMGETSMFLESGAPSGDFHAVMCDILKTGREFKGVLAIRKRNGEIFYADTTVSPLRNAMGKITQFFATSRDVSKNMRELEQLQRLANFDSLTGLPNRNLFMDRLQQALSQTNREKQPMALIYLDMDRFKLVNDSYGHASGDELLQAVALRLKSCVRQGDTVARLCGDEFAMILMNINETGNVLHVLNKIIYSFQQYPLLDGRYMASSCSIGVSIYPHDGEDVNELLRCADIAMYRAKAGGGNNYSFYCKQDENRFPAKHVALQTDHAKNGECMTALR